MTTELHRDAETECALRIDHVSKRFNLHRDRPRSLKERITQGTGDRDEFWAVRDVSLEIPRGSTFGLIGHNGSGKSSLLRLIAGIYRPTSGSVEANGRIAALLELGAGFHPELTGRENVFLNAAILGLSRTQVEERMDRIIDFSGLHEFIDSPVKIYSSGMYVRLGFAVAVHVDPDVLLIDEVVAVGDADFQRQCFDHLHELRRSGVTIVIVTHGLDLVRDMCDHAAWLDHGELLRHGVASEVVDAYIDHVNTTALPAHTEPDDTEVGPDTIERPGDGAVRVTTIEVLDAEGDEVRSVLSGAPCTVRLGYRTSGAVTDPVVAVHVHRADGTYVCGMATDLAGVALGRLDDEGTIDLAIPAMSLLGGTYELSVAVHGPAHESHHDTWERAQHVSVFDTSATSATGLVDLGAVWHRG